jgi:hypothetical protein
MLNNELVLTAEFYTGLRDYAQKMLDTVALDIMAIAYWESELIRYNDKIANALTQQAA